MALSWRSRWYYITRALLPTGELEGSSARSGRHVGMARAENVTPVGHHGRVGTGGALGSGAGSGVSGALEAHHSRLDAQFRDLRNARDRLKPGQPLFALEHGLDADELSAVTADVRTWLRVNAPLSRWWLPFVVYAAEIGYRYQGEEYWDTFEASTPGWTRHGSREYIRRKFKAFADAYGGYVPTGRWAEWFKNICWPITHAVLPTDLQRQLAHLLYEYRGALTTALLEEPAQLGAVLAARAGHTSRRFQRFAESKELLGQVAAALLTGEEEAELLLDSTLRRIVDDLEREREARRWLREAKRSADRVRLKGLDSRRDAGGPTASRPQPERAPEPVTESTTAPDLYTRCTEEGWQLRVEVPDFTPLFVRYPDLVEAFGAARCRVKGHSGTPRPRGWLRHPGQELTLDSWPGVDSPLFELERVDSKVNAILADEARTPPSQSWLFRVGPDQTGRRVHSGLVRAGRSYVLLGPSPFAPTAIWMRPAATTCEGSHALELDIPPQLNAADGDALRRLHLGAATEVCTEPVGTEPAGWDGEGSAEWVIGDEPLLMLTTTHALVSCAVAVNGEAPVEVPWPSGNDRVFLRLSDLTPGSHCVRFSFTRSGDGPAIPDGRLHVQIREPQPRTPAGCFREALMLLPSPASPSLEDLWEGRAAIEIAGPADATVTLRMQLAQAERVILQHQVGPIALPLNDDGWHRLFGTQLRGRRDVQRAYDEATSCDLEVFDSELGAASIRLDRSFTPLRWGFVVDHERLCLRLHDNVDSVPTVERYAFATPDERIEVEAGTDGLFKHEDGGLFIARVEEFTAGVILPRPVHDLLDLRQYRATPHLPAQPKSREGLLALLRTAALWGSAMLPGDPFAEAARATVLDGVAREICSLVGGGRWAALERDFKRGHRPQPAELEEALAKPGAWSRFRQRVSRLAEKVGSLTLEERVHAFSVALSGHVSGRPAWSGGHVLSDSARARLHEYPALHIDIAPIWLAEYALRVASHPASVLAWANEDCVRGIDAVLETPIILRAARLLVVALYVSDDEAGWSWP